MAVALGIQLVLVVLFVLSQQSFALQSLSTFRPTISSSKPSDSVFSNLFPVAKKKTVSKAEAVQVSNVRMESYQHDGYTLTYRYKPASNGYQNAPPMLWIHPVGIGLSSWFWEKMLEIWEGPAVYAPNLIGCGISEGSDRWNPEERDLDFPLGWVEGCEALIKQKEIPFLSKPFTVMVQGGLAPVGVLLASRNPKSVDKLVLTSPPTWKDMTVPVPQKELDFNFNFLDSKVLGNLAFSLLESRGAVEFFSNQFLFETPCDSQWLDRAQHEACLDARPPVKAFNAGFCMSESIEKELLALEQPTLIIKGTTDKRKRDEYLSQMKNCQLVELPGQNVLPWESPGQVMEELKKF